MLFNYESGIPEIFNRKGGYLPGNIAKTGWKQVQPMNSLRPSEPIEFGSVVKRTPSGIPCVLPIQANDTEQDFFGVAVSDLTSEVVSRFDLTNPRYIKQYFSGVGISVMTEGYIAVPVQAGTPVVGGSVYVRVAINSTNPSLPIGGIEATSSTGNILWTGAVFESNGFFPFRGKNAETTSDAPTGQCAIIRITSNKSNLRISPVRITANPTASNITAGEALNTSVLSGGTVVNPKNQNVAGTWTWETPSVIVEESGEYVAIFTPNNTRKYESAKATIQVTVE